MRRSLLIVICFLIVTIGHCGSFVLDVGKPSGGASSGIETSAPPTPYGPTADGYYGGMHTGVNATASGQITYSWTWTGTGTPPSTVVLKVESYARWEGSPDGTCSDGIDSDYEPTTAMGVPQSAISRATKYIPVNVNSGTVKYQLAPNATVSAGSATVKVRVSVVPISLSLIGPVGTSNSLAVGQLLTASVNPGSFGSTHDKYTWSQPGGRSFSNYQASAASAVFTPFKTPSPSSPTVSCYFGVAGSIPINCVYFCSTLNVSIPLQATVSVQVPSEGPFKTYCGNMTLLAGSGPPYDQRFQLSMPGDPSAFELYGQLDQGHYRGRIQQEIVTDPKFIRDAGMVGRFGYIQTVSGGLITIPGLDTAFPYPGTSFGLSDGNLWSIFYDSPGLAPIAALAGIAPVDIPYQANFSLYIFYLPPDDAAGSSVYIPIMLYPWTADGTAHRKVVGGLWTVDDSSTSDSGTPFPAAYPTWNSLAQ